METLHDRRPLLGETQAALARINAYNSIRDSVDYVARHGAISQFG
jgi:hypothetical protein